MMNLKVCGLLGLGLKEGKQAIVLYRHLITKRHYNSLHLGVNCFSLNFLNFAGKILLDIG